MGSSSVGRSHHGAQGLTADPVSAPLVSQQVSPPTGPCGPAFHVAAVCNRTGARDEYDARPAWNACLEGDERVVDHDDPAARSDAAQDFMHDCGIARAIDTRDAQTHGRWPLRGA